MKKLLLAFMLVLPVLCNAQKKPLYKLTNVQTTNTILSSQISAGPDTTVLFDDQRNLVAVMPDSMAVIIMLWDQVVKYQNMMGTVYDEKYEWIHKYSVVKANMDFYKAAYEKLLIIVSKRKN